MFQKSAKEIFLALRGVLIDKFFINLLYCLELVFGRKTGPCFLIYIYAI
jgi:hypothetical protein